MFQNYYENTLSSDPVLTIYLNGNAKHPSSHVNLRLEQVSRMSFNQLHHLLSVKFGFQNKSTGIQLRLFDDQGVEIYQEDLKFIQKDKVLYASDGAEFDPASCFSEYRLLGKLGEGGFGNVMLGQHKITKQKVAIKIMHTTVLGNAQDIDMVFREAEMLKSLRHKNIVDIYKCYTLQNMQVVFVMEYLEGGELLQYLNERGKLTEDESRVFIKQITEAVHYCHQQKLIHRDLKMENIILQQKGQTLVKLIDFGIAGLANNFNVDKIDVGSLRYMAPETISGRNSKIGTSIDVWALGVILYVLTIGHLPFKGSSAQEIKLQIMTANYQLPVNQEFSMEYKDLISRIFIVDPVKRIKVNDILNHGWMIKENSLYLKPHQQEEQKSQKQLIPRESTVKFVDEISPVQPKKLKKIQIKEKSPIREEVKVVQLNKGKPGINRESILRSQHSLQTNQKNLKQVRPFSIESKLVNNYSYHPKSVNDFPTLKLRKDTLNLESILSIDRKLKPLHTLDNIKVDTDCELSQRSSSQQFFKNVIQKVTVKPFLAPTYNKRSNSQSTQQSAASKKVNKPFRINSLRNT